MSAIYHIAQAIGGPPLPDGLSHEGRDFLRLCFNRWGASLLGHQNGASAKTCYSMRCALQQSEHVSGHSAIFLLPDPKRLPRQNRLHTAALESLGKDCSGLLCHAAVHALTRCNLRCNRNPRTRATAVELLGHDFLKPVAAAARSPGSTVASPVDRRAPVRTSFRRSAALWGRGSALWRHRSVARASQEDSSPSCQERMFAKPRQCCREPAPEIPCSSPSWRAGDTGLTVVHHIETTILMACSRWRWRRCSCRWTRSALRRR